MTTTMAAAQSRICYYGNCAHLCHCRANWYCLTKGNPSFSGIVFCSLSAGGSIVSGDCRQSLVGVANLLGLEVPALQRSLTSRVMTTTKGGAVGTIIK